jgi:CRP-like cAMP-binding protein
LEPFDVFGEISFFHPGPHSATVRCLTAVTATVLSRDKFDLLVRVGSHAAYKLAYNSLSVLAERLRHMDELAGSIAEQSEHPREEWREFQSKMYSSWKF